jgi:hypothetical protein
LILLGSELFYRASGETPSRSPPAAVFHEKS